MKSSKQKLTVWTVVGALSTSGVGVAGYNLFWEPGKKLFKKVYILQKQNIYWQKCNFFAATDTTGGTTEERILRAMQKANLYKDGFIEESNGGD